MRTQRAFTFIELIIVILIATLLFTLLGFKTGSFTFWREEGFIRRFSETIQFLHNEAISDQATYLMEVDPEKNQFRIGVLQDSGVYPGLASLSGHVGTLSLELAAVLNPPYVDATTLIPPPSFPSLFEFQQLPGGMTIKQIRTMRGITEPNQKAYISFSPRGFSEFAVIQMTQSGGSPVTFIVNPFTGVVDIFREYKDFEWTYGKNQEKN